MSAVPNRRLSVADYLAVENAAEFRSEYYDGEMFAMAGASIPHNRICMRLSIAVGIQLRGRKCEPLGSDQRVKIQRKGIFTYPDLLIVCGEIQTAPDDPMSILNPTAIVEIASPTTEGYDRGKKLRSYRLIPSLKEYVLISQDDAFCESFYKLADGTWAHAVYEGLEETLEFRSVPVKVPLAELYAGAE